ncbi:hypothetical protein LOTGIDRAFT_156955 [Lottia gigantea]|uniref:Uncharacterized protein n=1 Tax=Lottia gigantea TaxID=225164 RepID=V4BAN2_LOTGI|nr:hypothetical protein LOTGIDRAFT_156955 [Lottia gigantea]ESP02997.1 hypothetical protein LOTGIDRAFT_156955 [Lottia gigantea]
MASFKKLVRYKYIVGLLIGLICIQYSLRFIQVPESSKTKIHRGRRYVRTTDELYVIYDQPSKIVNKELKKVQGMHNAFYIHQDRSVESKINSILTAIEHGTSWIYYSSITEDINPILQKFNFQPESSGMIYTGPSKSTVDFHFIPRDFNPKSDYKRQYMYSKYPTSLIQTIFKATSDKGNIDYKAPHITVSTKTLPYFNQVNTLYSYSTFWALIPLDIHPYILSIWTGKLLELLDNYITYYSPLSSTSLSYLHYPLNSDIYTQLSLLQSWQCDDKLTFFTCLIDWSEYLKERDILSAKQVEFIYKWMAQLAISGYTEPSRNYNKHKTEHMHEMVFWPSKGNTQKPKSEKQILTGQCSQMKKCNEKIKKSTKDFDILLMVIFNRHGFFNQIDHLETIYRPHFSQILYCSSNMTDFRASFKSLQHKEISFVDAKIHLGHIGQFCIRIAMALGYNVKGYLHLGDDVVLNMWNLESLPLDKFWYQEDMKVANINQDQVPSVWKGDWIPWNNYYSRPYVRKLFPRLYNMAKTNQRVNKFMQQLMKNTGGKNRLVYQASDIAYIPAKYVNSNIYFTDLLGMCYNEIATPTIMNGLVDKKEIVRLPGKYVWHEERKFKNYNKFFQRNHIYIHPLKYKSCTPEKEPLCVEFYCNRYISCWFNY